MGFKDSLKNLFIIDEDELEEEFEEVEETPKKKESIVKRKTIVDPAKVKEEPPKAPQQSFSLTNSNAMKVILVEPKNIEECRVLVDNLKGRRPVIINLENIETAQARQIFDFLNGAVYALNGNTQKISNNIFIFAPESVDVGNAQLRSSRDINFSIDKDGWR
ncbi:MAG: cell division protein SepF [Clostridia bacterium]|nr:cell division protein SepF [Clostridia bacterium]